MSANLTREIVRAYKDVKSNMRLATKVALTNTAIQIRKDLGTEVKRVFDRPTNKTVRAFYYKKAVSDASRNIVAQVGIINNSTFGTGSNAIKGKGGKEYSGHGIDYVALLEPHIIGGKRTPKASEKRMIRNGLMKPGEFLTPARGVRLDRYGNVRGPYMIQVLAGLKQFDEEGFASNITDASIERRKKSKSRDVKKTAKWISNLFAIKSGSNSHLSPGIYVRMGRGKNKTVKKLFHFVKKTNYKRKFRFSEVIHKGYNKHFPTKMEQAVAKYAA